MLEDAVDTALEHEADDDVGSIGGGQFSNDVRRSGSSPPVTRRLLEASAAVEAIKIVAPARDHMANAATRVWNVACVTGDDVDVEMRNRLARSGTDVDANVEAVWCVTFGVSLPAPLRCPRSTPRARQASRRTSSRCGDG